MDFEEFSNKTKRIKLLRKGENLKIYALENNLEVTREDVERAVVIHGLYFPNDEQIKELCGKFNEAYRSGRMFMDLPRAGDMKDFYAAHFISVLKKELNINFERDYFSETTEFLRTKSETGLYERKSIEELTSILGEAFQKMNLMDSDIRIKALDISPRINIIHEFEPIQIGYMGDLYALHKKED